MVSSTVAACAFLSTGMISLAPNLLLFLFPGIAPAQEHQNQATPNGHHHHNAFLNAIAGSSATFFLSMGQALAAGGLLGDVFLHTLPDATGDKEETGLWLLLGFTLFLAADLLIRSLEHYQEENNNQQQGTNGGTTSKRQNTSSEHNKQLSAVILNLTADALHNFTDGLAIGATYAASSGDAAATSLSIASIASTMATSRGGLASLSVMLHEIPHELGDFCTLLRAGYSKNEAIAAQFFTAIAAFCGTGVALLLSSSSDDSSSSEWLLFVTAGGFVYLAATTIIPQFLQDDATPSCRLAQLAAFCVGIGLLYTVALLEDHAEETDDGGDHHHHGGHRQQRQHYTGDKFYQHHIDL